MENQIQTIENKSVSEKEIVSYLDAFGLATKLNDKEKVQFVNIAKAYNLNPFKREIYCVKYKEGDPMTIITGYESYLKRAERQGSLDGWGVTFEGEVPNLTATITIHRKDRKVPLVHKVWYSEYVQTKAEYVNGQATGKKTPNAFWQKAHTMLSKVAIAQGFRLAFPDELGGMPYTADELPETHEIAAEVVASKPIEATVVEPLINNYVHACNKLKKATAIQELKDFWSLIDKETQSHPSVEDQKNAMKLLLTKQPV
jgi:phage recombination protein Bet